MDSIHIQGYKSIKDATIELRPINILIGGNGSGKSNFLSFFEFLTRLYERRLKEYVALNGGVKKMLHHGTNEVLTISGNIEFAKDNGKEYFNYYEFSLSPSDVHLIFTEEYSGYRDDNKVINKRGENLSSFDTEATIGVVDDKRYRTQYIRPYLKSITKYHFHDTGKNSPFNQTSNIQNDVYFLYSDGSNIAAYIYSIKQKEPLVYKRLLSIIQSIAPYFSDFFFEANENDLIRLQWRDKYSEIIYGATDLSDGTLRFIALTVLFMQPKLPATIIIDEPELGLHPFAIAKLAGMMQSAAARGAQIIAATQSAELIDHFELEDILTVDMVNGESVFSRLNSKDFSIWFNDYSLGDLWKQNIIGKAQP